VEHVPAAPLNQCIRMLWYTQAPNVLHKRERVLPGGHVQVILNLARDFLLDCSEDAPAQRMAPSLIGGARSAYAIIDSSDMADLMGIVFHPGGFAPFAFDAVDIFTNQNISLEDVWGARARALRERLRDASSPDARFRILEDFLLQTFVARITNNKMVEFALSRFGHNSAVSRVKEVARETGWSMRYFSQIFREHVGLSPKVWCRIQRFQRAVQQLHSGVDVPWAELALECGYYDQSHFANEFRAFSGIDATSYCAKRTVWANHIPC
jgi:AraC-like DNA-binding protein